MVEFTNEELAAAIVAAAEGVLLPVALIDVDRFKQVNDRCSHAVGDAVGDGAGFSRSRAGKEHDGAVESAHGFALGFVQGVE